MPVGIGHHDKAVWGKPKVEVVNEGGGGYLEALQAAQSVSAKQRHSLGPSRDRAAVDEDNALVL